MPPAGEGQVHGRFHGNATKGNKFWVYPKDKALVTPRWDTHLPAEVFCTNCRRVRACLLSGGIVEYQCLGHDKDAQNHDWAQRPGQKMVTVGGVKMTAAEAHRRTR
eukprot:TRINITY_DN18771_c0_g1_i1.p2 TRINITY_DN18771_c0_g1~~TRINITY_DN18771_c0_g1_i1.p2  ORF type:complete len:106 (+),score=23.39 TRINITY_DN18771_c0_g1_i1:48-365(+)